MTGDLQKAAGIGSKLLSGLRKFNDVSVWRGVGKLADKRLANGGGAGARAVKGVANTMNGGLGLGLGAYGMAGIAGLDLPGSQLAMNIGMPGWGLATTAPNLIRSGRMTSQKNQDALKNDVMEGARYGTDDFMTAVNQSPGILRDPDGFKKYMKQYTGTFAGDSYVNGSPVAAEPGKWRKLQGIMGDSQGLIDQLTRRHIQQAMMDKQASKWQTAKAVGGGAMALLGLGAAGASAYDIGDSILGAKPYDEAKAQQEGYAGAQAAIQKRMNGAKGWERLAMRLDPTLAIQGLERKMPGAIAHWQKTTGGQYTPGWLSSIHEAWRTGGKPSYYTTDAGGNSHYIS